MKNQISIREAVTDKDIEKFWDELHIYFKRDIFPEPENEDRDYFLGEEYRDTMTSIHDREHDRAGFLFFSLGKEDIGFALPVIFTSEDGKCFIMEFCVLPEFRGSGSGKACARALMDWAGERGADYFELNSGGNSRRERFWGSLGFIKNGHDEWGEPLMILPPKAEKPFTVELLSDPEDWQLLKLENGFKKEIGEDALSEEMQSALQEAVKDGKITFLMAKRAYRAVGMCSITKCWSSFCCSETAVFEDFYIEPVFRKKGIARLLTDAARNWCAENGIASLSVTCADCDKEMYRALGFDTKLGTSFAAII